MKRYKLEDGKMVEHPEGNYTSWLEAQITIDAERAKMAEIAEVLEDTQRRYEEALGAIARLHSLAFDNVAVCLRLQREIDDLTSQVRRLENERS